MKPSVRIAKIQLQPSQQSTELQPAHQPAGLAVTFISTEPDGADSIPWVEKWLCGADELRKLLYALVVELSEEQQADTQP